MRIFTLTLLLFLSLSLTAQNVITLNVDAGTDKISRHIYGHFSEHLGKCIYGGFYVGEGNAKIPNVKGVRTDVVEALKKLKIPNLRWPGGCFADTYHWKDGIGQKDKRPTIVNTWWGGVTEDNSFGTHEFLDMCELLGTEPYISGNVGSGTVQELTEWVQYTTFDGKSPMSKLRADNGREKPWKVKYWGIGNEAWGCGGNMTVDYYANIYKQYSTFLTSWSNDNKIFRVASGANSSDYNWTEVLMRDIRQNMLEGVALHHYSVIDWNKKGSATAFTEEQYFTIMKKALFMEELVSRHSTIMDHYDKAKRVALVVDEWGGWYDVEPNTNPGFLFQQNTIRDAILAGATLNIFNNHADRVRMANLAQTVNVLQAVVLTDEEKMLLTPTYHVMEMYTVHHDATLIPIDLKTADYVFGTDKLPAVSASASRDAQGLVHISLVNIDASKAQEVTVDMRGGKLSNVTGRILSSEKIQDHNTFDQPNKIKPVAFKEASISGGALKVKLPPHSVVVLELK
jgi:alpha-N-arabinofuranosidase